MILAEAPQQDDLKNYITVRRACQKDYNNEFIGQDFPKVIVRYELNKSHISLFGIFMPCHMSQAKQATQQNSES